MANEINYVGDNVKDAGRTLIAQLIRPDGVFAGGPVPLTEVTPGLYSGDVPGSVVNPNELMVRITENGKLIATGTLLWDGTKEVSALTLPADTTDAVWTELVNDHDGVAGSFAEAIDAIPNVFQIADRVWDEGIAAHTATNTFGELMNNLIDTATGTDVATILAAIAALNNLSAAAVNAEVDQALADYDGPTFAELVAEINDVQADIAGLTFGTPPTPAQIADAVWDEDMAAHTVAGSAGASQPDQDLSSLATSAEITALNNLSTADLTAALNAYDAATGTELAATQVAVLAAIAALNNLSPAQVAAELATYDAATGAELVASEAAITAAIAALNNLSVADVNAEVDQALVDYDGPTKAELDSAEAAIIAQVTGLSVPTAAAIADQVWDEAAADHTAAGSMGATQPDQDLSALATAAQVAALNDLDAATVLAQVTAALTSYDAATGADVTGLPTPPSAAQVADAVWDEAAGDHTAVGSTGEALGAAGGVGATPAQIADAVWDEATAGHTTAGSFGAEVSTLDAAAIAAELATYDGATGAELAATQAAVIAAVAALNNLSVGQVATAVAGELATYDGPTKAELDTAQAAVQADIAALNNVDAASVAAAVWAAASRTLTDKTGFELDPTYQATLVTAIEAALLNEGDGQALIDAIVQLINTNLDLPALELAAIGSAVRTELTVELARIDVATSTRATPADVAAELATYDAPTKAELDAAQAAIQADIAGAPTAPTAAAVADAVWDEDMSAHTTAGSAGASQPDQDLSALATSAQVAGIPDAATIKAQADQALVDYDAPTHAELIAEVDDVQADIAALPAAPAAADIADAVWDEPVADHQSVGSTGEELTSAAAAGGGAPTLTDIVNGVWDAAASAHTTPGSMGATQPDQDLSALATSVEIAALNDVSIADIKAQADQALVDYDAATGTDVTTSQGAILAAITGLAVPSAAAVADAVWDEPAAAHTAAGSMGETQPHVDLAPLSAAIAGVLAAVGALNDLSAADVNAEADQALVDYGAATQADTAATNALVTALNNLSVADVASALATYDAPTKAELDAAEAAIQASITGIAAPDNATISTILKVLVNRNITDPVAGTHTIFDDDDTTVLLQGDLFENVAGTQRYQGQGADRRERLQ